MKEQGTISRKINETRVAVKERVGAALDFAREDPVMAALTAAGLTGAVVGIVMHLASAGNAPEKY